MITMTTSSSNSVNPSSRAGSSATAPNRAAALSQDRPGRTKVLVRRSIRREAIPDLQVVDPLVDRIGRAAVDLMHHDAVDGLVVDALVRAEVIGNGLAVDRHPYAPV